MYSKQQQHQQSDLGGSDHGSAKLLEGTPFTQQSHLSAQQDERDNMLLAAAGEQQQPFAKAPMLAHTVSAGVGGSARVYQQEQQEQQQIKTKLSAPVGHTAAGHETAAGGVGGNGSTGGDGGSGPDGVHRTHSWWPGWLGFTGSGNGRVLQRHSSGHNSSVISYRGRSSSLGDGHSSGVLRSLRDSSNGLQGAVDPESGMHAVASQLGRMSTAARPTRCVCRKKERGESSGVF